MSLGLFPIKKTKTKNKKKLNINICFRAESQKSKAKKKLRGDRNPRSGRVILGEGNRRSYPKESKTKKTKEWKGE